ncbi:MAG: hypothetical protein WCC90_14265, partial [Methylocella sp.]
SVAAGAAIRPRDDPGRRRDRLALTESFNESASLFGSAGGGPICFPVLTVALAMQHHAKLTEVGAARLADVKT